MVKTKLKLLPWDVIDHLQSDEEIALYLKVVLEDDDPYFTALALADIARAKGLQAELLTELQSQMAGGEAAPNPKPVASPAP